MTPPTPPKAAWRDRKEFEEAVARWAARISVCPSKIVFRRMTNKWASCSASGLLTFNAELLEQDKAFGEAVIVHELLHLIVPNHGPLFQSLLGAYMPGWHGALSNRAVCGALRPAAGSETGGGAGEATGV